MGFGETSGLVGLPVEDVSQTRTVTTLFEVEAMHLLGIRWGFAARCVGFGGIFGGGCLGRSAEVDKLCSTREDIVEWTMLEGLANEDDGSTFNSSSSSISSLRFEWT